MKRPFLSIVGPGSPLWSFRFGALTVSELPPHVNPPSVDTYTPSLINEPPVNLAALDEPNSIFGFVG